MTVPDKDPFTPSWAVVHLSRGIAFQPWKPCATVTCNPFLHFFISLIGSIPLDRYNFTSRAVNTAQQPWKYSILRGIRSRISNRAALTPLLFIFLGFQRRGIILISLLPGAIHYCATRTRKRSRNVHTYVYIHNIRMKIIEYAAKKIRYSLGRPLTEQDCKIISANCQDL